MGKAPIRIYSILSLSLIMQSATCDHVTCEEALESFATYICPPTSDPEYYVNTSSVTSYIAVRDTKSMAIHMMIISKRSVKRKFSDITAIRRKVAATGFGSQIIEQVESYAYVFTIVENNGLMSLQDFFVRSDYLANYQNKLMFFIRVIEALRAFATKGLAVTKISLDSLMVNSDNLPIFLDVSDFISETDERSKRLAHRGHERRRTGLKLIDGEVKFEKDVVWYLGDLLYYLTFGRSARFEVIEDEDDRTLIHYVLDIVDYLPVEFVGLMDLCFKPLTERRISINRLSIKVAELKKHELTFKKVNLVIDLDHYMDVLSWGNSNGIYELAFAFFVGVVFSTMIILVIWRVSCRRTQRTGSIDDCESSIATF